MQVDTSTIIATLTAGDCSSFGIFSDLAISLVEWEEEEDEEDEG